MRENRIVPRSLSVLALCLLAAAPAFGGATITIVNVDGSGEGFNDPSPRAPVGGNMGTTLGQQRLNAFQFAADIWGATLDSGVEIFIQSTFDPLACTPTGATLGSAGAIQIFSGFPPYEVAPNTWHHVALTNKRIGFDVAPGPNGTAADDIRARFNSSIGVLPGCLTGTDWYYGFDNNHGNNIDLVTVLLHEFSHGLGFSQFASVTTGAQILGLPDVYNRNLFDSTANLLWPAMSNAQRAASAINTGHVSWMGSAVTAAVPSVLAAGTPLLKVNSPAPIAGNYLVGTASFGPALASPGVTGNVVLAQDPDEDGGATLFTGTDGCSALTNAAAMAGNVAILDRGACGFTVKVKNAQNAGAIAVLVADNVAGSPPAGMSGVDPTITIPSVRITLADANTIKTQLGVGVNVTLSVDPTVRAGADAAGRALLYTPNPVAPGSTISHWDVSAFPNQLMEPAINSDLTHSVQPPEDLTLPLLRDVGWYPDADLDLVPDDGADQCLGSDLSPTVVIGGCDSGVQNLLFTSGCTITDLVMSCATGARNHGAFVSCVSHTLNDLKKAGIISGAQKGAIQSCAGGASIP